MNEDTMVTLVPSVIAEIVPSLTVLLQNPTTDPSIYWQIVDLITLLEEPYRKYKLQYAHLIKFYASHDKEGRPIPDPKTGEVKVDPKNWLLYEEAIREYDQKNSVQVKKISIPRAQIMPALIKAHIINLRYVIDFVNDKHPDEKQGAKIIKGKRSNL